jgi:hypothetical protein
MEGVRDGLDVRANHPHAPGYPVFIRLGQAIRAAGVEPFRATALAGALGGFLSTLALYLLLRELGSRRAWALVGALFYALTPSVWLHGVRPLSDGPGAAAALFAAVFLVRALAGRGRRALVWAGVFSALAAGVRPQVGLALLPAAAVAAFVVLRRERSLRQPALAVLAGVLVSAAIWLPVFRSSGGFAAWKERLDAQVKYVTTFDSPKAHDVVRPAFWKRWWLDPIGTGWLAGAFLLLGLAGAAVQRRKAAAVLLVFAPVTLLTLGVLSVDSAPRYALAFWAAPCALAAFALESGERTRLGKIAAPAAAAAILGAFAALGAPAIVEVATHESPSVAAMRAVREARVAPEDVFVTEPLRVHAGEYFRLLAPVVSERQPVAIPARGVLVGADDRPFGGVPQRVFSFESPRLFHISRARYLRAEIFEGRAGAGVWVPEVTPPGWQLAGRVELPEGTTLSVSGATPADVAFSASGADGPAEIEIRTPDGARSAALAPRRADALAFRASPDPRRKLFTVTSRKGSAVLDSFRILASGEAPTVP